MADMKVAAYICKGCGIGERLDAAQLVKIATEGRQDGAGARARRSCATPTASQMIQQRHRQRGRHPRRDRRLLAPRQDRGLQLHRRRACRAPTCAKA
ncbi:MAG: hypothetical protein MZV65_48565 [Chromatiales bacterium]|nr:hypothetical protein [Chromatiales bacterium]